MADFSGYIHGPKRFNDNDKDRCIQNRGPQNRPPYRGISERDIQELRRQVQELKAQLETFTGTGSQWNKYMKDWVGKEIEVELTEIDSIKGVLVWADKYTLGLLTSGLSNPPIPDERRMRIIHKAHVIMIRRA